jgi:hypothetical protein
MEALAPADPDRAPNIRCSAAIARPHTAVRTGSAGTSTVTSRSVAWCFAPSDARRLRSCSSGSGFAVLYRRARTLPPALGDGWVEPAPRPTRAEPDSQVSPAAVAVPRPSSRLRHRRVRQRRIALLRKPPRNSNNPESVSPVRRRLLPVLPAQLKTRSCRSSTDSADAQIPRPATFWATGPPDRVVSRRPLPPPPRSPPPTRPQPG